AEPVALGAHSRPGAVPSRMGAGDGCARARARRVRTGGPPIPHRRFLSGAPGRLEVMRTTPRRERPMERVADAGGTVAFGSVPSPFGRVLVAVTEDGVVATDFRDRPETRERIERRLGLPVADDAARTAAACAELGAYFAG